MKLIVPQCCVLVAVITVAVIGTFLVNVDAALSKEKVKKVWETSNDSLERPCFASFYSKRICDYTFLSSR